MPGVPLPRLMAAAVVFAFAAVALLPGSASAQISVKYTVDDFTKLRTLTINSDDAADTITPSCAGGKVIVSGRLITITGLTLACSGELGPQGIRIFAGGGNDTIDLTNVTSANFATIVHDASDGAPTDEVESNGGPGNDTHIGGPLGERFNDSFSDDDTGGDTVHGNGGFGPNLVGTTGNDNLFGDAGNDVIGTGAGADVAHGGPGNDSNLTHTRARQTARQVLRRGRQGPTHR